MRYRARDVTKLANLKLFHLTFFRILVNQSTQHKNNIVIKKIHLTLQIKANPSFTISSAE